MWCFHCYDREYKSWILEETDTLERKHDEFLFPVDRKLFNGDIISSDYQLISSVVRMNKFIPGVLVLSGSTYGRNSKGKTLYKCIPDDPKLPVFLIPYVIKSTGFLKKQQDHYVIFELCNWDTKRPVGKLLQNIGAINDNKAYYEYQLYRQELVEYYSIRQLKLANTLVLRAMESRTIDSIVYDMEKRWNMENRRDYEVISIDPEGCRDFDDAFGMQVLEDSKCISVYISNPAIWLEYLQLWDVLGAKVSSIYLPHRVVPMLPEILSTRLCSLVENADRPVLTMDITIVDNNITKIEYSLAIISVNKNYRYDESIRSNMYDNLLSVTKILQKSRPYVSDELDTHGIVAYYMMFMNHEVARILYEKKVGIVRNRPGKILSNKNSNVEKVMEGYYGGGAKYVMSIESKGHGLIGYGLDHYTHITSPIRRLVDMINMVALQTSLGLINYSETATQFIDKHVNNIEGINNMSRRVARVHSSCEVLKYIDNEEDISDMEYTGTVIDISDSFSTYDAVDNPIVNCLVYIHKIGTIMRVKLSTSLDIIVGSDYSFKIHIFNDEASLNRKIRLSIID
tara:strand:- start:3939 stop:5645 length:1707 start_codon:yes stop_codon:yes gene_type:complete